MGVFDGHGAAGHTISHYVKDNLTKYILADPRFRKSSMPFMLRDVFARMQLHLETKDSNKSLSARMSGTTATVIVHDHSSEKLTIAHVADSSLVLARRVHGE